MAEPKLVLDNRLYEMTEDIWNDSAITDTTPDDSNVS